MKIMSMISLIVLNSTLIIGDLNSVQVDKLQDQNELQYAIENEIEVVQPIEIYFMYGNEDGTYWLDPSAEYENVIYVDYENLIDWNIDINSLHHGNMFIGLFDESGWELIEIVSEEDLMKESL